MGNHNNNFDVKELIDILESKDFRRMDAEERASIIFSESGNLTDWYIHRSFRERATREQLCEALHDKKVAKAIKQIVDESSDSEDTGFYTSFALVLRDVIETQSRRYNEKDKVLEKLEACAYRILKPEIKELTKAADISKELAYELLCVVPTPNIVSRKNIIGIYVSKLNRKLYLAETAGTDKIEKVKTLRQIFKYLFGGSEEFTEIAISILLERRPSNDIAKLNVYSLLTAFALSTLESSEKEELMEAITRYGTRRSKEREGQRRIILSELDAEEYPRILKAVKKVGKRNSDLKEFL